jgi:hypothetical protein
MLRHGGRAPAGTGGRQPLADAVPVTAAYSGQAPVGLTAGLVEQLEDTMMSWNYTTFLNIAFLVIAAVLVMRFYRTNGGAMMKMMHGSPDDEAGDGHEHHGADSIDPAADRTGTDDEHRRRS